MNETTPNTFNETYNEEGDVLPAQTGSNRPIYGNNNVHANSLDLRDMHGEIATKPGTNEQLPPPPEPAPIRQSITESLASRIPSEPVDYGTPSITRTFVVGRQPNKPGQNKK